MDREKHNQVMREWRRANPEKNAIIQKRGALKKGHKDEQK
jgi:hypothetical protein